MTSASLTIDAAADEVYGLPLAQFTARRNALAAEARTGGDRALAEQIKALRRPSVVAWLVNQLVREHRDEVEPLLALGEALREATAGLQGPQLRALAAQQRQVVNALVAQARAIAVAAGQQVSEDTARGVADTLHAALADPDAAAQVAAGRLTAGLTAPGFGGFGAAASPAPPRRPTVKPGADERVAQARADLAAAESEAMAAAEAVQRATEATERADEQAAEASARVEDLRGELEAATHAQAAAARQARDAHAALAEADRRARDAAARQLRARTRLADLGAVPTEGGGS